MTSSFKILTSTWTRRVLWLQWMTWKGVYIPNPDHIQTHESDGDVQDFFRWWFLCQWCHWRMLKVARFLNIHMLRDSPSFSLSTSGFRNFTIFLGPWFFCQNLQCRGWFCFMMNRRRSSSSSSLSCFLSFFFPLFASSLLQRNSGERLRSKRRANSIIGGFRGTSSPAQSDSTVM